jgi:hypothetical protein
VEHRSVGSDSLSARSEGLALGDRVSLVQRAQSGDEAAFTLLIGQRQDRLYRLAWSILRNDADALDAAQETCIAAWSEPRQSLPRLVAPSTPDVGARDPDGRG